MPAGRIVQTGTEQSLWVHTAQSLGQRVHPVNAVVCHCMEQRNCSRHHTALGLWEVGKPPPPGLVLGGKGGLLPRSQFP